MSAGDVISSFWSPVRDALTAPFWTACDRHQLVVQRCGACRSTFFYPRPCCPSCWSTDVEWIEATGEATLYTWSIVHRSDVEPFDRLVPYIPALVDLAEGPRMMTRIVDAAPRELDIGMALDVRYITEAGVTVPFFTPAEVAR